MPQKVVIVGTIYAADEGAHPEHPIVIPPGQPPGIWGPNDPRPTPPIVLPIPPDAIAPGVPAHPIWIPIFPAHPIVIPPGSLAPGTPTHPIYLPPIIWGPNDPRPTPPIVIPPDSVSPGVPAHPIVLPPEIWGPGDPRPNPPIELPPAPAPPGYDWQQVYVPGGWRWTLQPEPPPKKK